MIDSIVNLLFRCSHRRLTRPVSPIVKAGHQRGQAYVVCLDCGKHFEYDVSKMRMGKAIDPTQVARGVPAGVPKPLISRVKCALLAAVPAAIVWGVTMKSRRTKPAAEHGKTT